MPSGMPNREQIAGFSRCQHGLSPPRLKPLVFFDVAASLKPGPDTNLFKMHHYRPSPDFVRFLFVLCTIFTSFTNW